MSESEKALRARAEQFYQLEIDQKYRQAEALVAEDTKDFYYASKKPQLRSQNIDKVEFKDSTHAIVTVTLGGVITAIGFPPMVIPVATKETWQLENGQWFWHYEEPKFIETPFGRWNAGAAGSSGSTQAAVPPSMANAVTADVNAVNLSGGPAKVVFSNHLPGPVSVEIGNLPEGLSVTFDKADIGPQGAVTATFSARAGAAPRGVATFSVKPLGAVLSVEVSE